MAGIALVVLAVLAAVPAAMALGARAGSGVNRSQVDAVAAWLRSHASEGASLFAWGDEPELYYTSGLSPATPWIYVTPLLMPGYGGPELSEEVARDLVAEPPEFVVDAGSASPGDPGTVPMLVPRPVFEGDEWKLDTIDPIRDVVRDLYGSPVEVAGWLIYERLPAAAFE
jgi:hypothetical protein